MKTRSLPRSVRQWQGRLKHLQQSFTCNTGKNGQIGVFKRVHQAMPFLALTELIFSIIYLGFDWFGIQLVCTILLFQAFWNLIIITRLQIIL